MQDILRTVALFVSAAVFFSVLASPSWSSQSFESIFAPQRSDVESRGPVKHSVFPKDPSINRHILSIRSRGQLKSTRRNELSISSTIAAGPSDTGWAWDAWASNGLGARKSLTSAFVRRGRRRRSSEAISRHGSLHPEHQIIRWGPLLSSSRIMNSRFMGQTIQARSGAMSRGAASECIIETFLICIAA